MQQQAQYISIIQVSKFPECLIDYKKLYWLPLAVSRSNYTIHMSSHMFINSEFA